jgi:hypothetical protein
MAEQRQFKFQIAEIPFSVSFDTHLDTSTLEDYYEDFLFTGEPEIRINAHYDGLPEVLRDDENKIFDSEVVWSLYQENEQFVFFLQSPVLSPPLYRIAYFTHDFRQGQVFSNPIIPGDEDNSYFPDPLEFPLSEVLMMCLLAQGRGIMMHACGIDDGGRGYLFAGNSTHGKSTLARIWQDHTTILNDDRIILRLRDGRFWMYGTPWHGDYNGISPHGVPLEKVFFLHKALTNSVIRIEGVSAISRLIARAFPPLWDDKGMSYSLDFCSQLIENVPCYDLDFIPNKDIVDYVRCVR